jgi:hypothetical protein
MLSYRAQRSTAVVLLVSLGGCYVQQPIGTAVPAPEARVVAQLTDLGSEQMAQKIGPAAFEVEGDVESATADTVKLRMRRVEQRGNISTTWQQEVVAFPRTALTGVSTKKMSKGRSWFAAAAIVGGSLLLTKFISTVVGGVPDRGGVIDPS